MLVVERSVVRVRCGRKYRELSPVFPARVFLLITKGKVVEACIRSVVLYHSETLRVIERKGHGEIRKERHENNVLDLTPKDRKPSEELLKQLGLDSLRKVVQRKLLMRFGHI